MACSRNRGVMWWRGSIAMRPCYRVTPVVGSRWRREEVWGCIQGTHVRTWQPDPLLLPSRRLLECSGLSPGMLPLLFPPTASCPTRHPAHDRPKQWKPRSTTKGVQRTTRGSGFPSPTSANARAARRRPKAGLVSGTVGHGGVLGLAKQRGRPIPAGLDAWANQIDCLDELCNPGAHLEDRTSSRFRSH